MKRKLSFLVFALLASIVVRAASPVAGLTNCAAVVVSGYTDAATTQNNFPLLVRISESRIPGFHYSDVAADGSNIRFCSADGKTTLYSFEVDTWNPEGESLVWVKIPALTANFRFFFNWGADGTTLAANTPSDVWSEYVGVWHMSEEILPGVAAATKSLDSTANGLHAVPKHGSAAVDTRADLRTMVSVEGVVGNGRRNSPSVEGLPLNKRNGLLVPFNSKLNVGNTFTLSGWIKVDGSSNAATLTQLFSRRSSRTSTGGWQITMAGNFQDVELYGGLNTGSLTAEFSATPLPEVGWVHCAFVYRGTLVTVYCNGRIKWNGSIGAASDVDDRGLGFGNSVTQEGASFAGCFDELRFRAGEQHGIRLTPEYETMANPNYCTVAQVYANGDNGWLREPTISKTFWDEGASPATLDLGEPIDGEVSVSYYNIGTGETTTTMPTAKGRYQAIFTVAETATVGALEVKRYFRIIKDSPYQKLNSDRVLLFSKDTTIAAAPVADEQNYYNTSQTKSVYWKYLNKDANGNASVVKLLQPGYKFELWTQNEGAKLWTLDFVRQGNTYKDSSTASMDSSQNYLPVSSKSTRYDRSSTAGQNRYGAHASLQNTTNAVIMSSLYSQGIGTIYFDAVNGWTTITNKIVVEVCTNVYAVTGDDALATDDNGNLVIATDLTGRPLLPTDDVMARNVLEDPETFATRLDPGGRGAWFPVPVTCYTIQGGKIVSTTAEPSGQVTLNCTIGGANNNFFRIRTDALNIRCPARFRIRRVDNTGNEQERSETSFLDANGLCLVDNIICSYPAMMAKVEQYGTLGCEPYRYGIEMTGETAIGSRGAFSVAYPSVNDSNLFARTHIVYDTYTNSPPGLNYDLREFMGDLRIKYRWRYLDQVIGPWFEQSLDMVDENPTDWRSIEPLNAAVFANGVGDIEYKVSADFRAPYYAFSDYTGLGLALTDFTECITAGELETPWLDKRCGFVTNDEVFDANYIRLREGKSNIGAMKMWWLLDGVTNIVEMKLVGNDQWVGYAPTPKTTVANRRGKVYFEASGILPDGQLDDYIGGNQIYRPSKAVEAVPEDMGVLAAGVVTMSVAPEVFADGCSSYLEFTVSPEAGVFTVSRADYQDFDGWTSAINTTEQYVGNLTETNSVSGQTTKKDLAISAEMLSVASNPNWSERFSVGTQELAEYFYPRNVEFVTARSVLGWTAENGKWVWERYREISNSTDESGVHGVGDGTAFQMQGRGQGALSYISATDFPKGVDTISCSLRLAQSMEFSGFSYDYGFMSNGLSRTQLQNYTVTAKGAFVRKQLADKKIGSDNGASLSLVAYYRPEEGCYELRIICVDEKKIRIELYKWAVGEGGIESQLLGYYETPKGPTSTPDSWITKLNLNREGGYLAGFFLSVGEVAGKTEVLAGINSDGKDFESNTDPIYSAGNGGKFFLLKYTDSTANRLTRGTYGCAFSDCTGCFIGPCIFDQCVAAPANGKTLPGFSGCTYWDSTDGTAVTFVGAVEKMMATTSTTTGATSPFDTWSMKAGRVEPYTVLNVDYGLQSQTNITQRVAVEVSPHGLSQWHAVATNLVTSFQNKSFTTVVHDSTDCDVRFKMIGKVSDSVMTDAIIDNVSVTQWRGQDSDGLDTSNKYGLQNEFVYTCAWVSNSLGSAQGRIIALQPTRGNLSIQADGSTNAVPMSVRSPFLNGMGMFNFSWRNADAHCKLLVQIATNNLERGDVLRLTQRPAEDSEWTTIDTLDFSKMTVKDRQGGARTELINVRAPQRVLARVVMASDVVKTALSGDRPRTEVGYGSVEITEALAWDLPAYDDRSWTGWNFRTSGWKASEPAGGAISDKFSDLWDGRTGLVGLLNNTLDERTLAEGHPEYYRQHPPYIQSPTYATNYIGQIRFRARRYDKGDRNPSVVSVWGSSEVNPDTGEPKSWRLIGDVVVTNNTYQFFTVKSKGTDSFLAVRLGVRGVDGVMDNDGKSGDVPVPYSPPARVAIDTISVIEQVPPSLRFKLDHVRPFRDATYIQKTTEVPDISDESEQPMLMEAFGFQAELQLQKMAENILVADPAYPITVDLCYYPYEEPWGYENWKTNALAKRVRLERATDTSNLVFRSSYQKPNSLVAPQQAGDKPYRLVQYHVIAQYYDKAHDKYEHELSAKDWTAPSWYLGFKDPNGGGKAFSAYTILDTILPHRAWFNEISYLESDLDKSQNDQRIELAVPAGVDMSGWYIQIYNYADGDLGVLARVDWDKCLTVSKVENQTNHYAFLTFRSPESRTPADNVWMKVGVGSDERQKSSILASNGTYGFELVRPSGVIEHQVVIEGDTAQYEDYYYGWRYSGTNLVAVLTQLRGGNWIFAGKEAKADLKSVGVQQEHGVNETEWATPLDHTFGRINAGQVIDPNWHREPNGDYVFVYANLTGDHIRQQVGADTNRSVVAAVMVGGSTNITYRTAKWYQLAPLSFSGQAETNVVDRGRNAVGEHLYELRLSEVSNRVDVTAQAEPDAKVTAALDAPDSDYKPAVMGWLERGVTRDANGNEVPFASDELKPFYYVKSDGSLQELSLTVAYWLDVDPTEGNWYFLGGLGEMGGGSTLGPVMGPVLRDRALADGSTLTHTNLQVSLWMALSNSATRVVHAPYRLQGLAGERSDDPSTYQGGWTSVTMKVTGKLLNDKYIVDYSTGVPVTNWVKNISRPLRYFVFDRNSFHSVGSDAPCSARVEVVDPFSQESPAVDWKWYNFINYSTTPVLLGWGIDRSLSPVGVDTLKEKDELDF